MPASGVVRRGAARVARSRAFGALVSVLERLEREPGPILPVLMYHRVAETGEAPDLDPALLSATPQEFEEQLGFLTSRRRVLSMTELLEVREGRLALPRRAVMVTFDDGYRDFADHAWPALRRAGAPATLFVATAYPDRPDRAFWWDRLHQAIQRSAVRGRLETPAGPVALATAADRARAMRTLRAYVRAAPNEEALAAVARVEAALDAPRAASAVLGWDELRALARDGLTIAPHTRTHAFLDRVTAEEARKEIDGSASDLERELGTPPPRVFAYPAGGQTDAVVEQLAHAGYRAAFTTERGANDLRTAEWLRLRRINVGRRSSLPLIRAQLVARPAGVPLVRGAA